MSIAGKPGLNPYRCSNVSVPNDVASQLILRKFLPANFTISAMPSSWHTVLCPIYAWLTGKATCTAPLLWGSSIEASHNPEDGAIGSCVVDKIGQDYQG